MKLRELYSGVPDNEWLEVLIHIESNELLKAISILRFYIGFDLLTGAKAVKQIAKEELNKEILTFIH